MQPIDGVSALTSECEYVRSGEVCVWSASPVSPSVHGACGRRRDLSVVAARNNCEAHEKITGLTGPSPIRDDDANGVGRSGREARTERAFLDSAGRIGRFPTSLNTPGHSSLNLHPNCQPDRGRSRELAMAWTMLSSGIASRSRQLWCGYRDRGRLWRGRRSAR